MELQSHLEEWAIEDLETYTRHEVFILSLFALGPSRFLPEKRRFQDILGVASHIESNGFGVWSGDRASVNVLVEREDDDLEAAL